VGDRHLKFHELRDNLSVVARTVTALAAEAPTAVAAAHCTSWQAHQALAEALPEAYLPNAVGSRFVF
jgi:7,8-dihydropterin-6-yl-methyl-4-(beta-D-ribofuranosyl)aminobenzene 5'-phosphate synthase